MLRNRKAKDGRGKDARNAKDERDRAGRAGKGESTGIGARIDRVLKAMDQTLGPGMVLALGRQEGLEVEVWPTGSLSLDRALGAGGYPKGRIIEIFGPESSGKTTLCLHAIAEVQRAGGVAAFVDAEHALDVGYAARLGVRVDQLLVSQPSHGEEALAITEKLAQTGEVRLIVVDSVAALVPRAELEGEMGDTLVGGHARLMNQAMRKLTAVAASKQTTMMFINQIRNKIGVTFGSSETTTGGNALKFFASVRLDIRRIQQLKDAQGVYGARTRVKVVKNKVAPPFRQAEFDILYGRGVDREGEILDLALESGAVQRAGSWFRWGETQLGQGREAVLGRLREDQALRERLEAQVLGKEAPAPEEGERQAQTPLPTPGATDAPTATAKAA